MGNYSDKNLMTFEIIGYFNVNKARRVNTLIDDKVMLELTGVSPPVRLALFFYEIQT